MGEKKCFQWGNLCTFGGVSVHRKFILASFQRIRAIVSMEALQEKFLELYKNLVQVNIYLVLDPKLFYCLMLNSGS